MLDINFIRENSDLIKEATRKKRVAVDVDKLLKFDEKRRTLIGEVDGYRAEQNAASERIGKLSGDEREQKIAEMRTVKEKLSKQEEELTAVEKEFTRLMVLVPNVPDPSVPEGESDEDNVEIRTWGEPPQFLFEPKDHITLMQDLNLIDLQRGSKVSGFRGYFLKNEAVLLSMALWQFALEELKNKGFDIFQSPALSRGESLIGTGKLPQFRDEIYATDDDLYLVGTAEIPLMGYYAGETLREEDLPKKLAAFSPCYRREAGSYGKDTKGIYRIHEFYKVEQVILCKAEHEESVMWHEEITKYAEEMMQKLGIPYRVVINATGDLPLGQVKMYDIEAWMPFYKRYRETHSSSILHDFQTRRLNIRYRDSEGKLRFAHSLNNTMVATPRILIALLENYQQEDGSVVVPEVLRKWIGKERIENKKVESSK